MRVNPMTSMIRDHRSSLLAKHAAIMALVALAVMAVGILMGLGAVDLYEAANSWVLRT
jgi:ABC-type polysaccharide/polyol phosphate export permease